MPESHFLGMNPSKALYVAFFFRGLPDGLDVIRHIIAKNKLPVRPLSVGFTPTIMRKGSHRKRRDKPA